MADNDKQDADREDEAAGADRPYDGVSGVRDVADETAAESPSGAAAGDDETPDVFADDPGDEPPELESPAADEPPPAPGRAARPSRAPLYIAILAFLLAALAAAGVALQWFGGSEENSAIAALRSEIDRLSSRLDRRDAIFDDTTEALARTREALIELQSTSSRASGDLEELERLLDARLETLEAIPARLRNLESSLAALRGISSGLRDTWLLAEAEYYLQIANAQLALADNPEQARTALTLADERIASLADPALTDVRRAIANELRRIDAMDVVELEGAALRLSSLANSVESLPLKADVVEPDFDDPAVAGELSGMDRAIASLKASMSDVISVRRSDAPLTPLLPPEAAFFLRNNVTLKLQAAQLAMLKGEEALYEQSLDDAADWIAEYFDGDSRQVTSALEAIAELRDTPLEARKPDISGSLSLLRQFMTLRTDDGPAAPPATDDDTGPRQ